MFNSCNVRTVCHFPLRRFPLQAISKQAVVERGQQKAVLSEKKLVELLTVHSEFVPLVLSTFVSDGYLFSVFKVRRPPQTWP